MKLWMVKMYLFMGLKQMGKVKKVWKVKQSHRIKGKGKK